MNPATATPDQTFQTDLSKEAVIRAIQLVRATHDEIDPRSIEGDDSAPHRDRRCSRRVQLQIPVAFTSVDEVDGREDLVEVCGPEQIAVTRDISSQGLGIVHDMPLMTDLAFIQFDMPGESPITMLYEVRWTSRKTRYSYVTGGRLTGVVVSEPCCLSDISG